MKRSFSDSFARFMYGRYGADEFSKALSLFALILFMVGIFLDSGPVYALVLLVIAYNFYRSFSKNIAQRQRENAWYCRRWTPVKRFFTSRWLRLKNSRRYRYLHCPACKTDLRVPRGKGAITLTCPKCHKQFDGHS